MGSTDVIGDAVQLCKDVLIVPNRDLLPLEVSPGQGTVCRSRSSSVQEVLNRLVSVDVRAKSNTREQDRNILSLGYRLKVTKCIGSVDCNVCEPFFAVCAHSGGRASWA